MDLSNVSESFPGIRVNSRDSRELFCMSPSALGSQLSAPNFRFPLASPMHLLASPKIWFVTGSQHLYGPATLEQVARDSQAIVRGLNDAKRIPLDVVFKPTLKTPEEIRALCLEANHDATCAGL